MTGWLRMLMLLCVGCGAAAQADERAWISESNRHSQVLLDVIARYEPERAAYLGVEGHDSEVFDVKPRYEERREADLATAAATLAGRKPAVSDRRIRQDIDILVAAANRERATSILKRQRLLPYFDLPQALFLSFQNLLDPRIPRERQANALLRLRRYAGAERGYEPIASLVRTRTEERLDDATLIGPWVAEVEHHLDNQQRFVAGIRDLFARSKVEGWQQPFASLQRQLDEYSAWVRGTVMPRARPNNQLPPELYADALHHFGVTMQPHELIDRALAAYMQTRDEMATLAGIIAERRDWPSKDYRDVVRQLKQQRLDNDRLLAIYRERLASIESTLRSERIVKLPDRSADIRLATEAESAVTPAPHVDPPRLIGNTGEAPVFVLPLRNPSARPDVVMDDFIYDAVSWTLTAHEARPGHELQFSAMLEQGVSIARVVFAFNSANLEGWALYSEALMKKHLPLEGQFSSLHMRLMRAARAFLDPMLNLGLLQPDAARRFLIEEVMLSEPMAQQEVDRYTFRTPGQAPAYFFGYSKLAALRTRAELALAGKFVEQAYHDFILEQGALPLDLLEKAVVEDFIPADIARRRDAR